MVEGRSGAILLSTDRRGNRTTIEPTRRRSAHDGSGGGGRVWTIRDLELTGHPVEALGMKLVHIVITLAFAVAIIGWIVIFTRLLQMAFWEAALLGVPLGWAGVILFIKVISTRRKR